jgi:hypothetical protein
VVVIIDGEGSPVSIPPDSYLVCRRETNGSDFSIVLPVALIRRRSGTGNCFFLEPRTLNLRHLSSY